MIPRVLSIFPRSVGDQELVRALSEGTNRDLAFNFRTLM
jgi:hypothetical protein